MNRKFYLDILSDSNYDNEIVENNPKLLIDIMDREYKLTKSIQNLKLKDGIKWSFGFSNYINKIKNPRLLENSQKVTLKKGHIVLVDFFGHFGDELTYDHYAVVLKADSIGAVVAPITSNLRTYSDNSNPELVKIPQYNQNMGNMKKNSTIKLRYIRYISRTRIIKVKKRISNTEKLDELDDKILLMLTPLVHAKLIKQQEQIKLLKTQIKEFKENNREIDPVVVDESLEI